MSAKPYIIVAGLARCGTTLTMHMLHAAGIPCIGEKPAFEPPQVNHCAVDPAWLAQYPGRALKVLNPHETPLPSIDGVVIWLDRDPKQQAASQIKFNAMMMPGLMTVDRGHRRRWVAGLVKDRPRALAALPKAPTLVLRFEDLIHHPYGQAMRIAQFLAQWWPDLDWDAMAAVVRPRSARCAPGLDIELALLDEAGAP